jgi:hypothetical protein
MGLVQSKWEADECRHEDGIFYPDDTFIRLTGRPCQGYQASTRQPIQTLIQANPEGWTDIDPGCSFEYQALLVVGGGTSWEGDGFLAVMDAPTRQLIWLLHLSRVERFTGVQVDGSILQAVSEEYPYRHEWTIPLENPHLLHVNTTEEN